MPGTGADGKPPDEGATGGEHHERQGRATRTMTEIFEDLNSSSKELETGVKELTPSFMKTRDREALHTRKLELETQIGIYKREYAELNLQQLNSANQTILAKQKSGVETNEGVIKKFFEDAAAIDKEVEDAHKLVDELRDAYELIKQEKQELTPEFLETISLQDLQRKKNQNDREYYSYLKAYLKLKQKYLPDDSLNEMLTNKADLEKIEPELAQIIKDNIKLKQANAGKENGNTDDNSPKGTNLNPPPNPASGPSNELLSKEPNSNLSQETSGNENQEPDSHAQALQALTDRITTLCSSRESDMEAAHQQIMELRQQLEQATLKDQINDNDDGNDIVVGAAQHSETQQNEAGKSDFITEVKGTSLKIDSVSVPFFDGTLEEWEPFKEMFDTLVGSNTRLSKVMKFYELRSHLQGAALETIKGYQLIGSNYDNAWADLRKRYDHSEEIVDEYLLKFLKVPAIQHKANFSLLRAIIDVTNQMLRALPGFGLHVEHWDPFVNLVLKTKLDETTRGEWKQKRIRNEVNPLKNS